MKSGRPIMLLLIAVALLAAPAAWGQGENPPASSKKGGGSVEQQIKALHEQSRQAALKGDVSFLEKYLSDDYVGIAPDGSISTKDQAIQMLKSGAIKYDVIDEREVKVRVYGGTAIVNGLASLKLTVNGTPISGDHRATFVWVKQKGNWKEVSFEGTRVATASQ
jgi:ketosteroid isomerase-like protein